jgi:hypothetical protein
MTGGNVIKVKERRKKRPTVAIGEDAVRGRLHGNSGSTDYIGREA